ncbi:hypothetical protein F5Y16DRAFT_120275 [Xylariaceae sp. FL0255]|nr:hypothetical protein F5Y16DRAFT_120275 [Xylariaceae sp. FL0255]
MLFKLLHQQLNSRAAHGATTVPSRLVARRPIPRAHVLFYRTSHAAKRHEIFQHDHYDHHLRQTQRWINNFAPRDPMPQNDGYRPTHNFQHKLRRLSLAIVVVTLVLSLMASSKSLEYLTYCVRHMRAKRSKKLDIMIRERYKAEGKVEDDHEIAMERMIGLARVLFRFEEVEYIVPLPLNVTELKDSDEFGLDNQTLMVFPTSLRSKLGHDNKCQVFVAVDSNELDGTEMGLVMSGRMWWATWMKERRIIPNPALANIIYRTASMIDYLQARGEIQKSNGWEIWIGTNDDKLFYARLNSDNSPNYLIRIL